MADTTDDCRAPTLTAVKVAIHTLGMQGVITERLFDSIMESLNKLNPVAPEEISKRIRIGVEEELVRIAQNGVPFTISIDGVETKYQLWPVQGNPMKRFA